VVAFRHKIPMHRVVNGLQSICQITINLSDFRIDVALGH